MSGITRDFSQQSIQELRDIIRKNLQDNQWGFFDWFDDTFLMQELNIKNYINNVNEYHAKMIDKHNMGSAEFDRILERVHTVDENYSARINSLADQAKALQTRIEQLTKMIDPSVITANPGDFARLADGIDSKYQKVKVQSEARMKQCEASMPVLYDKQWYENVVDSIEAGVNVAGQVGEGIGWGLVDVAKDLVFGVKDTAVGLFHYLTNNPQEENALFIANIYVQSEKQNKSVPQFLWDSLTTDIWNGLQTTADDFAKGDLKTKSEMATRVLGNLALFFVPATTVVKVGKAGEAVELAGNLSKVGETAGFAEKLSQADEAAELLENLPKAGGIAEFAGDFSKAGKAVGLAGDLPKAGEVAEFAEDFNWGEATELAGNLSEADEAAELLKNLPKTDEAAEFAKDFSQASGSDPLINAEKALEEERAKIRIEKTAGLEEGVTQGESESEQAEIGIDEAKREEETKKNTEGTNNDFNEKIRVTYAELKKVDRFLKKNGLNAAQRREVIEAFNPGTEVITLDKDLVVYRYYGGGANSRGRWVTIRPLNDPTNQLALPPGSTAENMKQWVIPKGTEVLKGTAAPHFGRMGGAPQIYLPNQNLLK